MIVKKLKLWLTRCEFHAGPSDYCTLWLREPYKLKNGSPADYEARGEILKRNLRRFRVLCGLKLLGLKPKHLPGGAKLEIDVTLRIKGVKP